jgi:hyperosmotically inducible protein
MILLGLGGKMKKTIKLLFFFLAVGVLFSGCGTIYKAAMDERSVGRQAKDEQIEMEIRKKFLNDDNIETLDISTYCYNGDVYLVGEYGNRTQKSLAINLAKGVEGVKSVTDHFLPKKKDDSCGTKENIELIASIKGKLIGDKNIWSTNIEVKAIRCNVILLGLVGYPSEITDAIAHAKSVQGVRKVTSYLKVSK